MTDERPILFSAPMVRALLDGTKTQTRRVVRLAEGDVLHCVDGHPWRSNLHGMRRVACPYGAPGDRLWVKETWCAGAWFNPLTPTQIGLDSGYTRERVALKYLADDARRGPWREHDVEGKTRAPIHMPRWASRITLQVTDVRVQRVQTITDDDARAEGVERGEYQGQPMHWRNYLADSPVDWCRTPRESFFTLWDSINGKRPGCAWGDNPWVWAITFERVT